MADLIFPAGPHNRVLVKRIMKNKTLTPRELPVSYILIKATENGNTNMDDATNDTIVRVLCRWAIFRKCGSFCS